MYQIICYANIINNLLLRGYLYNIHHHTFNHLIVPELA
nr:MAG TPA: hypothetical protein [Caudoviricetes sp.]